MIQRLENMARCILLVIYAIYAVPCAILGALIGLLLTPLFVGIIFVGVSVVTSFYVSDEEKGEG